MTTQLQEQGQRLKNAASPEGDQVDPKLAQAVKLLDNAFAIPGTKYKVGVDGLIGLIPIVGDLSTGIFAAWMVREAQRLGVPLHKRVLISFHYGVDFLVGLIPLVGDVFDFGYKAHLKSLRIIEQHLKEKESQVRT